MRPLCRKEGSYHRYDQLQHRHTQPPFARFSALTISVKRICAVRMPKQNLTIDSHYQSYRRFFICLKMCALLIGQEWQFKVATSGNFTLEFMNWLDKEPN